MDLEGGGGGGGQGGEEKEEEEEEGATNLLGWVGKLGRYGWSFRKENEYNPKYIV